MPSKQAKLIFWVSVSFFLITSTVAVYWKMPLLHLLPFSLLFLLITFVNFRTVFFLMLFVLPFSTEAFIGEFGIDLPSEPLVMLLSGFSILYFIRNKEEIRRSTYRHPIFFIIALQFVWSCIATCFSSDVYFSVKYLLAKLWYLLCFLVLPVVLIRKEYLFRRFFWCLFLPTLFSILFVLIKHATRQFDFDSIQYAVNPIYRNHVNYAVFITMMLPFLFLAKSWYPAYSFKYKLLKYSIPVFLGAIYLSYTRGAWLAVGTMLIYYYVLRFKLTKYVLAFAFAGAIGFCSYILYDNNYLNYAPDYEHTIYHDELADHLSSTFEMEDMSTVERFYRWIAAIKLSKENPVVGVGPNNFVSNYKQHTVTAFETYISDNDERSTVHNYFLLLLSEQGFPALLLFLLLIIVTLLTAQQEYTNASAYRRKYILALTLCIIVFLLNNTLSDLVEANKVGSLFLMCLGLLAVFSSREIELSEY